MDPVTFLDGRVTLHAGDCLEVLDTLPESSVDAVITDPPYHYDTIVARFGKEGSAPAKHGTDGVFSRASAGFMGKDWDGGDVAFRPETWAKVLRVLKPGGHLAAFSAPKCVHKMAWGIEAAGFEVRDRIINLFDPDPHLIAFLESLGPAQADALFRLIDHFGPLGEAFWTFGSGFPKSHNISKAIDKMLGAERKVVGTEKVRDIRNGNGRGLGDGINAAARDQPEYIDREITAPGSPEASTWEGWGTALKPAYEPIVIARKPVEAANVAAQVLATGTGGVNVDAMRVGNDMMRRTRSVGGVKPTNGSMSGGNTFREDAGVIEGRFPANLTHDGSEAATAGFPQEAGGGNGESRLAHGIGGDGAYSGGGRGAMVASYADNGSAARFFYTAKADGDDRLGSGHPTVKPLDLIQWLCRGLCPAGGTILDLFAGTGTTGEAAFREGFSAILIEREAEYRADIARRMGLVLAGRDSRRRAARRAKAERQAKAASEGKAAPAQLAEEPVVADIFGALDGGGGRPMSDGGIMAGEGGFGFRRRAIKGR